MAKVTKNLRDAELKLTDGDAPANVVAVTLDEGDLSYDETNNVNNILDRGILDHMRKGDEEPVKVTFTLKFVEFLKQVADADPTVYEVFKKIGGAAAWVSTNTDGGDVYTLTAEFTIVSPTVGDQNEKIVMNFLHHASVSFSEGDEYDTISFDGEAFVTAATITKV